MSDDYASLQAQVDDLGTRIVELETKLETKGADEVSHNERIGIAYVAGLLAARAGVTDPLQANPYYGRPENPNNEEWVAFQSGWRDEMARRQKRLEKRPRP